MGVRKNVHIENWAGLRENLEHTFKFSRSNWAKLAIFGIAVPFGFYKLIVNELVCCLVNASCSLARCEWASAISVI